MGKDWPITSRTKCYNFTVTIIINCPLLEALNSYLILFFNRTYTQYSMVVQAFNKLGAGPMSDEVKQYTAEGIPEQPPQDTTCTTLTSQTIRVSWVSPPLIAANGVIKGYKVVYGPSDTWYGEYVSVIRSLACQSLESLLNYLRSIA